MVEQGKNGQGDPTSQDPQNQTAERVFTRPSGFWGLGEVYPRLKRSVTVTPVSSHDPNILKIHQERVKTANLLNDAQRKIIEAIKTEPHIRLQRYKEGSPGVPVEFEEYVAIGFRNEANLKHAAGVTYVARLGSIHRGKGDIRLYIEVFPTIGARKSARMERYISGRETRETFDHELDSSLEAFPLSIVDLKVTEREKDQAIKDAANMSHGSEFARTFWIERPPKRKT